MIYYSPLISYYKSRRGALPAGEQISFRLVIPRSFGVTCCYFIYNEDDGEDVSLPMYWEQTDGSSESWKIEFSKETPGLVFYRFGFDGGFGFCNISRDGVNFGAVIGEGEYWQLTVYDGAFRTPDFIKGGLIYQIFPDRFCASGKPKKNVPSDRVIRTDSGLPYHKPTAGRWNRDFFGGDFAGVTGKLDYLAGLGVTCIYLNPICESHSNHRYDTADYRRPDPLLGTMEEFTQLCAEAEKRGIAVIVDGVFSHTGADSLYFNKFGRYGKDVGAYNDPDGPYSSWYIFGKDRDDYKCWWDVPDLPEVRENDPAYTEFICGEGGVVDLWLSAGAKGFRLDVADELPNEFLDALRRAVKRSGEDKLLLGEVWEDATNKISGGGRRRFLLGRQLDCVMNYPFMNAVVDFMLTGDARTFMTSVASVVDNYPPEAMNCCMNHLGTHDTARILTTLSGVDCDEMTRDEQAEMTLNASWTEHGKKLLKAAVGINFFLPGVPSVYYGDEAGLTGGRDPFNRRVFPWGREDAELLEHTRSVSQIRKSHPVCVDGGFYPLSAEMRCIAFLRYKPGCGRLAVISNMNSDSIDYTLNADMRDMLPLLGGEKLKLAGAVRIPAETTCILADCSGGEY